MVRHREKTVGVGWQIDARDGAPLGEHHVDKTWSLVRETVVVVSPSGRGKEDVERCDRLAPGELYRLFLPLGVLHHHRGGNHAERLVGRKETVATREQVALEPALTQMLAQDLHHPAGRRDVVVYRERLADEAAVLDLEDGAEPVRVGLVRAQEPEVGLVSIPRKGAPQQFTELAGGLAAFGGGPLD